MGGSFSMTARSAVIAVLLAVAVLGLVACDGSSSAGGGSGDGASGSGGGSGGAPQDSFLQAYPKAQAAMAAVAADAVLLAAGTGGLALADVPANRSFT